MNRMLVFSSVLSIVLAQHLGLATRGQTPCYHVEQDTTDSCTQCRDISQSWYKCTVTVTDEMCVICGSGGGNKNCNVGFPTCSGTKWEYSNSSDCNDEVNGTSLGICDLTYPDAALSGDSCQCSGS